MRTSTVAAAIAALLAVSCSGRKNGGDAGQDTGDEDGADAAEDAIGEDTGPEPVVPIPPVVGTIGTEPLDCAGAYAMPDEITGADGLGHHGWTLDDLEFTLRWSLGTRFDNDWISRNDASSPSLRTNPWLVPEAGRCYVREIEESVEAGEPCLAEVLGDVSAFSHPKTAYDALVKDTYEPHAYDPVDVLGAVRGLVELPNELPGAPVPPAWDAALEETLGAAVEPWPEAMRQAVARLVLAIGEAHALKMAAIAEADDEALARIHQQFLDEVYGSIDSTFASPQGGTVVQDIITNGDWVDLALFTAAGLAVAGAADEAAAALAAVAPFDSPGLDVLTPHGRIIVSTVDEDTEYAAETLADAALVVDLAGDDTYHGRFAATHRFWMGASVVVDAAGSDAYSPETADIESETTRVWEAFDNATGFTQGAGLMGVGVLVDAGGDDTYAATSYAQGSGAFGVGILHDAGGTDSYKLGNAGQGQGFFGTGMLIDSSGNDRYGIYTTGQGSGRPYGHGLLLDMDGTDTYIGYYQELEPELPAPGYQNYFRLSGSTWPYSDSGGNPHYMSNCQGIGWGFRGDWFSPQVSWMGGFGALVDLGTGDDVHYADCMSMGQGFVYGFGLLYDGGGSDTYHTFWWGPAAAAHMGVGLLLDDGGDDDIHVAWASGGFGYDCSVGWLVDGGGNDTYGGQFHYGMAYTYGMTFFVNEGGNDVYNDGSVLADPPFGIVNGGAAGQNLAGVFVDLGGGTDTYNTACAGVGNDAEWYLDPIGSDANPAIHKGIGIDR